MIRTILLVGLLAGLLVPMVAAAQTTTERDAACWKPAFTDCVATTDGGGEGVTGCHGNYFKCLAGDKK
jgi:hypothetical protein